jgi:hypothetical protein
MQGSSESCIKAIEKKIKLIYRQITYCPCLDYALVEVLRLADRPNLGKENLS